MLQLTARDARQFGEASRALLSPHESPQCAAWRDRVTVAVRALFVTDRALLLVPQPTDLAPGTLLVVGTSYGARWPAAARWRAALSDDSALPPGAHREVPVPVGPYAEEVVTAFRGWPAAVPLPPWSGTFGADPEVSGAVGFGVSPPAWAWVHLVTGAGTGGALLIVGSCGALSARFTETDALLLGAMLRPAFVAGVRDARARWGPRWGALGDASRPLAAAHLTAHLTAREHEIAVLLAQRRTNREIAAALTITEHTARHHTERVLRKLRLSTRRDVPPR